MRTLISCRTVPRPTCPTEGTVTSLTHRVLELRGASQSSRAEVRDTDKRHYTGQEDRGWSKMGTLPACTGVTVSTWGLLGNSCFCESVC